ncbi:hypothetical protein [Roseateles asaccharophilus]|uniref:hypothetical protein n=1 Tax=Roseateles asaccharophilus TaxID=582607 RepID=UPI00384E17CC
MREWFRGDTFDEDGTGADVIEAINSLPSTIEAKAWLMKGFGPGANTLAERLLLRSSLRAIKGLIAHNTRGLSLDDLCTAYDYASSTQIGYKSLAYLAVTHNMHHALRYALEQQPEHPDLSGWHTHGNALATLHFSVLHRAATARAGSGISEAWGSVQCAELLLEHNAPVVHQRLGDLSIAGALYGAGWQEVRWMKGEMAGRLDAMSMKHFEAGRLNPDSRIPVGREGKDHLSLLMVAIRAANAPGVRSLLRMGADVPAGLNGASDAVHYARTAWATLPDVDEMVAMATEGVLERHTQAIAADQRQAVSQASQKNSSRVVRRAL